MAELEREIGHSCINGVFLDELDRNAGEREDEISTDCGIFCHLFFLETRKAKRRTDKRGVITGICKNRIGSNLSDFIFYIPSLFI